MGLLSRSSQRGFQVSQSVDFFHSRSQDLRAVLYSRFLQNYGVRKLLFLLTLLEMGLDVSLSDTDVVWYAIPMLVRFMFHISFICHSSFDAGSKGISFCNARKCSINWRKLTAFGVQSCKTFLRQKWHLHRSCWCSCDLRLPLTRHRWKAGERCSKW